MMKRLIFATMLMAAIAIPAGAQTPTTTTPQSVTSGNFFNAVTTAQISSNFTNLGQTVHFLFYQATGGTANPQGVQIRLEGSFDGTNFIAISDDGTDPGQVGSNVVLGIGAYPFIRANLLKCTSCNVNNSITASYFGTSSMPGNPFGSYGAGQQIRKVLFVGASTDSTNQVAGPFVTPYGSTAGFLLITSTGGFGASSTITVRAKDFAGAATVQAFTLPTAGGAAVAIPVAATAATTMDVRYTRINSPGNTFTAYYYFFPPGAAMPATAQPANTNNTEATAAANTAVVTTLTVNSWQRAHLFSVNAKCSAGTAQLTVADGATTIWSSAATEVGTTSFPKSWNPGLPSSPGNNLVITLGACGAANTGTLDVQGSVF
jgi:hypothetical protein